MAASSAPSVPLSVLIACAPEDALAVRALAQRLRVDGMNPALVAEPTPPRALRDALATAAAVVVCLSRRAVPGGQLVPTLAHLLEVLALTNDPQRLTLALRLTSCAAPSALRASAICDLFSASGYERLLAALRDHATTLAPPPPLPVPEPPPPTIPALRLRGGFGLPALEQYGLVRRLGRGVARAIFMVDAQHALVVSGGGPALTPLAGGPPLWAIDCPTSCAALSPSGRLLALAASTQIFLWDLADGSLRGRCKGHTEPISALAFAPDARTLASASHDRSVRLWRTGGAGHPPTLLSTLPKHAAQVTSVAFSPDGALVAAGDADRTVRIWRSLDQSCVQSLAGHGGAVETLAFSPDGATLAVGARGRQVRLWATDTWRVTVTLADHGGAVETLAFSPDGALLATGATDQHVRLWRCADGTLQHVLRAHAGPVTKLAFSPDGATLASVAEDARLLTWHVADGVQRGTLRPLSGRVTSLALSRDDAHLAVGTSNGAMALYDLVADERAGLRQHEPRGAILSVAFAAGGRLVSAAADGTVRVCQRSDGESRLLLQTHGAMDGMCLAPDGHLLAHSDGAATVQLWRLAGADAPPGGTFWCVLRGLRGRPRLIAFAPRADAVAVTTDDGTVALWRISDPAGEREPALTLVCSGGRVRSVAFSADGALLAAGGDSGTIQIWRTLNGVTLDTLPSTGHAATSLAFAPDGRTLAVGDALGTLRRWRIGGTATRRRPPVACLAHAGAVAHLVYGAGSLLVSGSADGTARVWRV